MEITFEDGVQESMLPMFEMEVGDGGKVVMMDSGEYAPVYNDAGPLEPDEIGGFVKHPRTGQCVLLRDHFCDITDYVREDDEQGMLSFLR